MNELRKTISENLNRRYVIEEGCENILLNSKTIEEQKFQSMVFISNLINENYSEEKFNQDIDEGFFDSFKKFFTPGGDTSSSDSHNTSVSSSNLKDKGITSLGSQFREYLIGFMLRQVGFKGPLSDAIATAFADVGIYDLIHLFKGGQGCQQSGPKVADAVMEGMGSYILSSMEMNSIGFNYLRSVLAEYLRASDIGEKVAGIICGMAYKKGVQNKL